MVDIVVHHPNLAVHGAFCYCRTENQINIIFEFDKKNFFHSPFPAVCIGLAIVPFNDHTKDVIISHGFNVNSLFDEQTITTRIKMAGIQGNEQFLLSLPNLNRTKFN